jgi:hypothetical protein
MKLATFLESRTDEKISFDKINFTAVPHKNVAETQEFFKSKGTEIVVVPLEFIELYMTKYSLREIVTQDYL